MVKNLRRWDGNQASLTIHGQDYQGRVEVEQIQSRERASGKEKTEHRYFFKTDEGERIPIAHYGKNKVIVKWGKLVRLTTE